MYLKKFKINLNENGIGLIEVIASFTITVVVITSLVALALYTIRSSLNSKLLLEGTKIATREVERVRGLRDTSTSWTEFMTSLNTTADCMCATSPCAKKCYMTINPFTAITGETTEVIDNQNVIRYFNVTQDAANPNNILRVSVYVLWNVGGQEKSTHLYTDLTNWQTK
jgi:Tfp pilus assembly protein PilV